MHHAFKLKNNRLNNREFNIDQNNHDYDFFHNRAAHGHNVCVVLAQRDQDLVISEVYM